MTTTRRTTRTATSARPASRCSPRAHIDVIDVAAAVEADKLTEADVFKRTYLGHGTQSSVFVFQGHAGPVPDATSTSPTTRSATCSRAPAR